MPLHHGGSTMDKVFTCISLEHDKRLLTLAVAICCLSGIAAISLFRRARSNGRVQMQWLATAGIVTGSGIWATHFIAMLAYRPGIEISYDISLTTLSLLATAAITTAGFWIALGTPWRYAAPLGGGIVGVGIAVMHYIGMSALEMPAEVTWSIPLVTASVVIGIVLGAAALSIARSEGKPATIAAAATLCVAILAHHFTAMGAIVLVQDPARSIEFFVFDPSSLALAIACAAIAALGMGLVAALYDRRLSSRAAQYERAQRDLTMISEELLRARNIHLDAALNNMSQALCMFDANGKLIVCNDNYARIFSLPPDLVSSGASVEDILSHRTALGMFPGESAEAYMRERLMIAASNTASRSVSEFPDGRVMSVWHQPMAGGGWVATHEDITEQTRAQRELKELNDNLELAKSSAEHAALLAQAAHQQLIDASNLMAQGLVLFDAEDRHVLWNERYAELLGDAREVLAVGVTFEETVRAGLAKGRYAAVQDSGEAWVVERMTGHRLPENNFEMRLAGGQWIRVDERRTSDGGSIGVRIDITEWKRREESLRLLFSGNPLPMLLFDKETFRLQDVNDAAVIHYGWTRQEFLAMSFFDLLPYEERGELCRVVGSRDGSQLEGMVWRHHKADGEQIDVAIYSRPLEHNGRPAALAAVVDITQARRAEAEVLSTREFLNSVIESVPAPIIVKDARTLRHVLVNRAAENFLGMTRDGLIGRTADEMYSTEAAALILESDLFIVKHQEELVSDEHCVETPHNGERYVTSKRKLILDAKADPRYILTVINDVTERRFASERIAHLTSHDPLTGLPNRGAFGERLAEAIGRSSQRGIVVLCIDLDRFKEVNEVFGHAVADRILAVVARRLREAAAGHFLARVGGDEFNLVLTGIEHPAAAAAVADALMRAAAEMIEIDERHINIGLSIGVAIAPDDGVDAATLAANAEAALYRAKNDGRGIARFFEAETEKRLRESRALGNDLKTAVELGQLCLYYQPQTDVAGRLLGFEALARWQHPTRGLVPPDVFIPIAEQNGLIVEIGDWILREACREAASWPGSLSVAVNLSPAQFRQSDFFTRIHSVLVSTGFPGNRLELEITEGVLMDDSAAALGVLRRAKALGIRIAMDDFGTGYSSLSYLQSFPFDKIKIDRSFIANLDRNPQSKAIVRGVLGLAHGLHLPVIAEGVETEEQLTFLEQEGCNEIQGYLMGRPRPIAEYSDWIVNNEAVVRRRRDAESQEPPASKLPRERVAQQ
jgi:diguanylate cyclase (GGDEF)-like protein/PAS domain S-box-containing protein